MALNSQCRIRLNGKVTALLDKLPKRTVWNNHVIDYRITVYHNILGGFVVNCN